MLFKTHVLTEGSKGGHRITVPVKIANQLRTAGVAFPGWIRLCIDKVPFFAYARFPACRPSVAVTIPTWAFPQVRVGDEVEVEIGDAEPHRVKPSSSLLDWASLIDDYYFGTADGTDLVIHSRHEEPFRIRRTPIDENLFWWLLGLYQAEGSISKSAGDWNIGASNYLIAAAVPPSVENLGIPRDRQHVEVMHKHGGRPKDAEKLFAGVGLRISSSRLRSGLGEHTVVLHVDNSKPLLRLFKAMLARIFDESWKWPSREAAKWYAFGWLDGDGNITIMRNTGGLTLALSGYVDEQKLTISALEHAFGWHLPEGTFGDVADNTHRTLRLDQAADLAVAGAFPTTMNRAKLIWGLEQRLIAQESRDGNRGRSLTSPEHFRRAQRLFLLLKEEAARLAAHPLAKNGFNTGIKGLPYPL